MTRRIAVLGIGLLVLLAAPRRSDAGLIEFIWEMSGPQMIGASYNCRLNFQFRHDDCPVPIGRTTMGDDERRTRRLFLLASAALLVSTGKDSATAEYEPGETYLAALEPGLTYRSLPGENSGDFKIYHSAGITYGILFGKHFHAFDKFGLKIIPVEVQYKRVEAAFTLRFYPHGFTNDEFGHGERQHYDRSSEWVLGFGFNIKLCVCGS
jgi:hypothetical protein